MIYTLCNKNTGYDKEWTRSPHTSVSFLFLRNNDGYFALFYLVGDKNLRYNHNRKHKYKFTGKVLYHTEGSEAYESVYLAGNCSGVDGN